MSNEPNPVNAKEDFTKDDDDSLKPNRRLEKTSEQLPASDQSTHLFECRRCGYVYDPEEGLKKFSIPSGTSFLELDQDTFRCPVCRARKDDFRDIGPKTKPSGFQENMNYGFGVNNLTAGQKNVLIFGGLAFALACFLSLYSLN